jgi:hypothetical protein
MPLKHIFTFLLIAIALTISAQTEEEINIPVDEKTGLVTYREVVDEKGDKDELFNRCIYWLNEFYANPVSVTKKRDFESGVIKGEHQFRIYYIDAEGYKKDAGMLMYDFTIEFKQDRYRYTVTDFLLRKASRYPIEKWLDKNNPEYNENWGYYLEQIDKFVREQWVPSLKEKMQPEEVFEEEEW